MPTDPPSASSARRAAARRAARTVRRSRTGPALHPSVGADRALLAAALDVRLGYLLGAPDLARADVGATVLTSVAPGPVTRAATERTVAGFLSEHAGRASELAPGRLLGDRAERALATDAVVLALLAAAAGDGDLADAALAAPARSGLDDERLHALVDPRLVAEVARLARAAETSLWRPLATTRVGRVEGGRWRLGDVEVAVDLREGRWARADRTLEALDDGGPVATWLGRYERLVVHEHAGADVARPVTSRR